MEKCKAPSEAVSTALRSHRDPWQLPPPPLLLMQNVHSVHRTTPTTKVATLRDAGRTPPAAAACDPSTTHRGTGCATDRHQTHDQQQSSGLQSFAPLPLHACLPHASESHCPSPGWTEASSAGEHGHHDRLDDRNDHWLVAMLPRSHSSAQSTTRLLHASTPMSPWQLPRRRDCQQRRPHRRWARWKADRKMRHVLTASWLNAAPHMPLRRPWSSWSWPTSPPPSPASSR
jgi:hypothetical protein